MANIETLISLLKLLRASEGEIDTRIRIQKEAYLLAVCRLSDFRASDFYYHHYGPYSRGISDTLQYAVSSGLIEEFFTSFDESFTRYNYRLTPRGRDLASKAGPDSQDFISTVNFLRSKNWRALELAATVRFLELNEGYSDRDAAFHQALALKPTTAPYRREAEKVLKRVG